MDIRKEWNDSVLTVYLAGKLDTNTAPQTEKELEPDITAARQIVLDIGKVQYVSSAGLRLILKLHKGMKEKEGMTVRNVNESVTEVFDLTGFSDIMHIE